MAYFFAAVTPLKRQRELNYFNAASDSTRKQRRRDRRQAYADRRDLAL
jgi:hypothetical protein